MVKKAARIILGGPIKAGAKFAVWGGKKAGKGSVWVVKKAVVDPATMKVLDWGPVRKAGELKQALKRGGSCVQCGKVFRESNKRELCSPACAQAMAASYNVAKEEKVTLAVAQDNDLYLNCGCNRKNVFHGPGCAAGLHNHRVADNIKWSESDPRHMKPSGPSRSEKPDHKKSARELHHDRVRAAQEADKNRPWWQKKKGLDQ